MTLPDTDSCEIKFEQELQPPSLTQKTDLGVFTGAELLERGPDGKPYIDGLKELVALVANATVHVVPVIELADNRPMRLTEADRRYKVISFRQTN